jgi:hypothetical protein
MIIPGQIIIAGPPVSGSHSFTPDCSGPVLLFFGIDTGGSWSCGANGSVGMTVDGLQGMTGDVIAYAGYVTVTNNTAVVPAGYSDPPGVYIPILNNTWSAGYPKLWSPSLFNPYDGTYDTNNSVVSLTSNGSGGYNHNYTNATNLACECAISGSTYGIQYGVSTLASYYGNTVSNYASGDIYYPKVSGSGGPVFYGGSYSKQGILDIGWWMGGYANNPTGISTGPYFLNSYYPVYVQQNVIDFLSQIPSSTSAKYEVLVACTGSITGAAYFSGTDGKAPYGAYGYMWIGFNATKAAHSNGSGPYGNFMSPVVNGVGVLGIYANGNAVEIGMSFIQFQEWFPGLSSFSYDSGDTIEFWCGISNVTNPFCIKNMTGGWHMVINPA